VPVAVVAIVRYCRRGTLLLAAALPFALMLPFLDGVVLSLSINSLRALAPALSFLIVDYYCDRGSGAPAAADRPPAGC